MENFTIEIINLEVCKKYENFEDVITRIFWRYSLENKDTKIFICYRTPLDEPQKKDFVKLDKIKKDKLIEWICNTENFDLCTQELIDLINQDKPIETYTYIVKN